MKYNSNGSKPLQCWSVTMLTCLSVVVQVASFTTCTSTAPSSVAFLASSTSCTSTCAQQQARRHGSSASINIISREAASVQGMWTIGNNFGKGRFRFYEGFDDWMSPFPAEDREKYPEMFALPEGTYEVQMVKPLGIVFEEINAGRGVFVQDLVEGGRAERQGIIQPGDELIAITAVKVVGAKWERRLIPAMDFDFDTVVGAIGSNEEKWGCNNVILQFQRPGVADADAVKSHLEFFEPPSDSPWKVG